MKDIGRNAFANCDALETFLFADNSSVTNIGASVFSNCRKLTAITLPECLQRLGPSAFYNCSSLTGMTIPNSVRQIEVGTFERCTALAEVPISNTVTDIGANAFRDCNQLAAVDLPEELMSIESYAFNGCGSLTSIDIPDTVSTIENNAFRGCSQLASVSLPSGITSLDYSMFSGCERLAAIEIPNTVTNIGSDVFSGCKVLSAIEIPGQVTSIGSGAFSGCTNLTSVAIPESVTRIGESAFQGCSALGEIVIPNSVTNLGGSAFSGCSGLKTVSFEGEEPPEMGGNVFGSSSPTIYYPVSAAWTEAVEEGALGTTVTVRPATEDEMFVTHVNGRRILVDTNSVWCVTYGARLGVSDSVGWDDVMRGSTGKTDAGGKALTVLADYIAGTDPTDADDTFKAIITMGADGKPVITWHPALNDNETSKGVKEGVRTYKVFGNTGLSADGWMEVEQDASGDWRRVVMGAIVSPQFFKVSVAMP